MNYTEYFGFVYLWHDTKHNKFIIGSHHGSLEDGYTTTTGGKHVSNIFKSRPDTMRRRVLEYCYVDDFRETQKLEQKWLDLRPNISQNDRYYNLKQYATGGVDKSIERSKPSHWVEQHRRRQLALVKEGKHNFNTESCRKYALARVSDGSHHFLHSDFNKKPFELYLNGELLASFESKVEAVNDGIKAGVIDKLRRDGILVFTRGSRKKYCSNKLYLFKKNDILEYKQISYVKNQDSA